ncbi:MAG: ParB/RepB/Spo0J family partition protein [Oscillospiraceae bacterium]|nr:ParB/RepB/Spo0J family partition protein [Oscillospiraceae bacterium]
MVEETKNPLFGAFRTPAPGTAPPTTALSGKPADEKKPDEPGKTPADSKAAQTTGTTARGNPTNEQKPVDPAKAPADSKATQATGTAAPAKPADEKKPDQPGKTSTDGKAAQTADITTPGKAADEKKPTEPSKIPADGKAAQTTATTVLDKSVDEKKPAEPGKPLADSKAAQPAATVALGKPADEKKTAEPSKISADSKAMQTTGTPISDGMKSTETDKVAEEDIPKNLKVPIAPESGKENVTTIKLSEIHPFEGHPYSVKDDKDMWDLVESVRRSGVIEPIMVIRDEKQGGYEMVSGHRRHRASQLVGLDSIPVLVRNIDRDSAIIAMVDANLKRENISPMEKARAYAMKLDALKRKAGRRSKSEILNEEPLKRADEQVAEEMGESRATVQRTARLTKLVPELQEMVDEKRLPVNTGADISYLKPDEQKKLADAIKREDKVPSGTQAVQLKEASKAGTLTPEKIERTVAPTKREEAPPLKVTFNEEELRSYFPDRGTTVGEVKRTVFEALDLRQKALEREKAKIEKEKKPSFLSR